MQLLFQIFWCNILSSARETRLQNSRVEEVGHRFEFGELQLVVVNAYRIVRWDQASELGDYQGYQNQGYSRYIRAGAKDAAVCSGGRL
jgi:prolyl-tRNA synthetase